MRRTWLPACAVAACAPVCLTPISNPDIPWHLSAGRYMIETGRIPRYDFLSWSKAGASWADFQCLAQLLFYGLSEAGGAAALWLFKAAVFILIFSLFAALLRSWRLPDSWTAAAVIVLCMTQINNLDIRPEMFSLLFGLIELRLLEERRTSLEMHAQSPSFVWFLPLFTLWANLHGAFALGLALLLIYSLVSARRKLWAYPLAAAGLGTLINPAGIEVYGVAFGHAGQSGFLGAYLMEWAPPTLRHVQQWPYWGMFCFCALSLAALYARGRSTPKEHLLVFGVLAAASLHSYRYAPFFCLLTFPLVLRNLHELSWPPVPRRLRQAALALGLLLAAVLGGELLRREKWLSGVEDESMKVVGVSDFLKQHAAALAGLRLYNPWDWGGFLGYELYPAYKVFVDGRYIFHEYLPIVAAAKRDSGAWREFLDAQGIDLVLMENLDMRITDPDPRSDRLSRPTLRFYFQQRTWALIYWDSQSLVFVRRGAVPPEWLGQREYRLIFPKDALQLAADLARGRVELREVQREARRYLSESSDENQKAELARWIGL